MSSSQRKKVWSHKEACARAVAVDEYVEDVVERVMKEFSITRLTAVRDVDLAASCLSPTKRKGVKV